MKKTAVVIGTGIAGLSIAEFLSRHNYQITLIDKNEYLGGQASLQTQKWFHSGWLYSALPDPSALDGCTATMACINDIYKDMDMAELNVKFKEGKYKESKIGWFDWDPMFYFVPKKKTFDISWWKAYFWPKYYRNVALTRLKTRGHDIRDFSLEENFVDLTTEQAMKLKSMKAVLKWWDSPENYSIFRSSDIKLNTDMISASLIRRLGKDTELHLGKGYQVVNSHGKTQVTLFKKGKEENKIFTPDVCIMASGVGLPSNLTDIHRGDLARDIKSVKSPILVLNKELPYPNFIRYTPEVAHTVNHVKYRVGDKQVSTIGSYHATPLEEKFDMTEFMEYVNKMYPTAILDDAAGTYFGIKTEYTAQRDRRYNHYMSKVNGNTYAALAGKFSQFPLLVKEFSEISGLPIIANNFYEPFTEGLEHLGDTFATKIINQ